MKSNARVDRELKAIAEFWNAAPPERMDQFCALTRDSFFSAVYHTLRWARGYREPEPAAFLKAWLDKELGK